MRRHLDRRIRVATAAALLAPALLLTPAIAQAATSPAATGHLPTATSDDPDGQWWDYQEPAENAAGQDTNQEPRAAKTADDEDNSVQEPGTTRRPSADSTDEQPNRRSLPDESGDSAKPSASGEKEQLFGADEPKTADAPKAKNFDDAYGRVSQGRNADVPKGAKNGDAATEKAAEARAPMKDPYDVKGAEPPKSEAKAKGRKK